MSAYKGMWQETLDSFFGLQKHHRRIKTGVDTAPLLQEFIDARSGLRSLKNDPYFNESSIYAVRFIVPDPTQKNYWFGNITKNAWTQNYHALPKLTAWLEGFAKQQKGKLAWVLISIVIPEGHIQPHTDNGFYFSMHDRYHLILKSGGSIMLSGGQRAVYNVGEVWWFNNKVLHTVLNESGEERIHVLVDILPDSILRRIKNFMCWIYWGLRPRRLRRYYLGRSHSQLKKIHSNN